VHLLTVESIITYCQLDCGAVNVALDELADCPVKIRCDLIFRVNDFMPPCTEDKENRKY
jgi:hypothetical protein